MRDGFRAIVSGWMLIDGLDDITDRIEQVAQWDRENGPLLPDETATLRLMIQTQIYREMFTDGMFFPETAGTEEQP